MLPIFVSCGWCLNTQVVPGQCNTLTAGASPETKHIWVPSLNLIVPKTKHTPKNALFYHIHKFSYFLNTHSVYISLLKHDELEVKESLIRFCDSLIKKKPSKFFYLDFVNKRVRIKKFH